MSFEYLVNKQVLCDIIEISEKQAEEDKLVNSDIHVPDMIPDLLRHYLHDDAHQLRILQWYSLSPVTLDSNIYVI